MRSNSVFRSVSLSLVASGLVLSASNAFAAGYELLEQSGEGVGQAYAGVSTGLGDGSEVFFNPAAMTNLTAEDTLSLNTNFIAPHAKFKNEGSSYIPQLGGTAIGGNNGGDGGEFAVVPNLYWSHKFNDSLAFGFGLNSPFGLSSGYNDTWVGRYHAIKSELKIVNINPALAYKVNDMLSLGVNMQVMHADAQLTNAIDFGTIGVSTLGLATASRLGLLPQRADGLGKVDGDDWGVGMGLSALFTPSKDLRFGVNYRSKVDLNLEGSGKFTVPSNAAILTSTGAFTNTSATADVTLPESLGVGGAYDIDQSWTMFADATWVRWSRFQELRVKFGSVQPDSVQAENWNNTWRYSIGTRYTASKNWRFRTGFTWDQTPVPSSDYRTPRIPDNDRYWLAFGADYTLMDNVYVSLNYAHLFVPGAATSSLANATGAVLNGNWDLGVDIVGLELNAHF